jgi:Na+/H+ antiporter NhaD/arsenite permease-like protein
MLYVMGIMLAVGVVAETGAFAWVAEQIAEYCPSIWILGVIGGFISIFLDNFATAICTETLYIIRYLLQRSKMVNVTSCSSRAWEPMPP